MIQLPDHRPAADVLRRLGEYQKHVDVARSYAQRVDEAKRLWSLRNKRGNQTFDAIKTTLDSMCSGARRCCYCEDSAADEVEHIKPKNFFPELVFAWDNYLYACGPCNGPKGTRYGYVVGDEVREFVRRAGERVRRPPASVDGLIDPRHEDPMELLGLDLVDTFWFVPRAEPGTLGHARAEHTIELLHLNDRDVLPRARNAAYHDYARHLEAYAKARDGGASRSALARRRQELLSRQHPTVFREMQRNPSVRDDLARIFAEVPEALAW